MKNCASPLMALLGAVWSLWTPARLTAATEAVSFRDVTAAAGISFRHSFGDDEMSSILEATGSGCLFFDYDADGWVDLYAVNGAYLDGISDPPEQPGALDSLHNQLFHNEGDGTFTDVSLAAGVDDRGYGMACISGDYDNDGRVDIYVTNYGRNTLYRATGAGRFSDATSVAGVGDERWGVGAAFFDMDNDGDLDLYLGNYLDFDPDYRLYYAADLFPGPLAYPGQADVLYRNQGDGTFQEVTRAAGVYSEGRAMGLIAGDMDADGWVDIFVANDAMGNALFHNRGDGTFVDVALEQGVAFSANGDASSSMGGDLGDFDEDGDFDLFVPDMSYNNLFVLNADQGYYEDRTTATGVAECSGQYVSWHGQFFDYDNDADLDIYISNGDAHHLAHTMEPLLLANERTAAGHVFMDVSDAVGPPFRHRSVSRGAAIADYDNDGDLDLFVLHLDQPSVLLRNEGGNHNHYLEIALQATRSNPSAIGTLVRVYSEGSMQLAQALGGQGYLSQSDPRLHFGLGQRTHVDSVIIRWPGGRLQKLVQVAADQVLQVLEPSE